jgi:hypothetical protein
MDLEVRLARVGVEVANLRAEMSRGFDEIRFFILAGRSCEPLGSFSSPFVSICSVEEEVSISVVDSPNLCSQTPLAPVDVVPELSSISYIDVAIAYSELRNECVEVSNVSVNVSEISCGNDSFSVPVPVSGPCVGLYDDWSLLSDLFKIVHFHEFAIEVEDLFTGADRVVFWDTSWCTG